VGAWPPSPLSIVPHVSEIYPGAAGRPIAAPGPDCLPATASSWWHRGSSRPWPA